MNFKNFKDPITRNFAELVTWPLFVTAVPKDDLWATYLASFPEGSNPVFRERTEHDCSCCRHFVKLMGNVVAVVDGELKSIWDTTFDEPAYQAVADAMSALVKSKAIEHPFLHYEKHVGTDKNFEYEKNDSKSPALVSTWEHFHVDIPYQRNTGHNYFCKGEDIATKLGEARTSHDVFLRGLQEIKPDAIKTVLDLIKRKALYRGEEYAHNVNDFQSIQNLYNELPPSKQDAFVWLNLDILPPSVSKIRGTAIGTLLVNLSDDMGLEEAVNKYEVIMAPENYKRSTALVTQAMIDKAQEEIVALGLESALERRYATLSDVSVNDILFADRTARKIMRGGLFDLPVKRQETRNLDKIEEILVEEFVEQIIPNADTIEVMFENKHTPNLVSLIAPQHVDAKPLFKWDNGFSWAYNGDVTDSVKERVKKAGGNVTGDLCCRLAWSNFDDLDLHMLEPGHGRLRGNAISFHNKGPSAFGGQLDVDMNAHGPGTREPVENIFYGDRRKMAEGVYELFVHQYAKRESINVGFEVEIDFLGNVTRFVYEKAVRQGERIVVARIKYKGKEGIEITSELSSTQAVKEVWGLQTQRFHRVSTIMLSPNYWHNGGGVGNKHYIFMMDGCANDGKARGFFNEFLRADLYKHSKVLEMVGARAMTEPTISQLSGLGFSSTQRNELLVRVKGTTNRTVKVIF